MIRPIAVVRAYSGNTQKLTFSVNLQTVNDDGSCLVYDLDASPRLLQTANSLKNRHHVDQFYVTHLIEVGLVIAFV